MKSKIAKLAFLAMMMVGAASMSATAQVYVSVRPLWHPIVRPAPPTPRHVWIDEEWEPRGGVYVATGGHWVEPPHPGWVWIPGHWVETRRGEYWRPGHWARR